MDTGANIEQTLISWIYNPHGAGPRRSRTGGKNFEGPAEVSTASTFRQCGKKFGGPVDPCQHTQTMWKEIWVSRRSLPAHSPAHSDIVERNLGAPWIPASILRQCGKKFGGPVDPCQQTQTMWEEMWKPCDPCQHTQTMWKEMWGP